MAYVYRPDDTRFTVGFYDPDGEWQQESWCTTDEKAAARCSYLNGGLSEEHLKALDALWATERHKRVGR